MIEAVALYFVSEDCNAWANFLKTKLGEKAYDICVHDIEASQASECKEGYKANIILVSPGFLELPDYNHFSKFPEKQALVVLLGVDDQEFEDTLKARGGEQILKIPLFETEANESSVRYLLVEIIDLYEQNVATENALPDPRLQEVVHQQDGDVSFESDNDPYDVPPSPKPIAPPKLSSANELQKFILNEKKTMLQLCNCATMSETLKIIHESLSSIYGQPEGATADTEMSQHQISLTSIHNLLSQMNSKLNSIQLRSDSIETRMLAMENKMESFNNLQRDLNSVHTHVANLDEEVSVLKREEKDFENNPTALGSVFDSVRETSEANKTYCK
ncbi:uncharacterized protein LOC130054245 [Ostrea edulis]|uniref:uncharacterized protein LOC130054245 n=1 Tax=Ostrea edulis TaxID=37623 RepID=UPI0024AFAAA6|nr:uncharacterized protein LOC130054245 [Ostrea edulis]